MSKLAVGDRAEIKIVGNVTAVHGHFVELDNDVYIYELTPGVNIRRLSRPKPKQGEVLTGRQVQETMWRRGTIFRAVKSNVAGLVLRQDGQLYALDNEDPEWPSVYQFDDLNPEAEFELRFVA